MLHVGHPQVYCGFTYMTLVSLWGTQFWELGALDATKQTWFILMWLANNAYNYGHEREIILLTLAALHSQ